MNYPIAWVALEKYVEMTGDSVDAVMARRKIGKWLDGDQCKMADGPVSQPQGRGRVGREMVTGASTREEPLGQDER